MTFRWTEILNKTDFSAKIPELVTAFNEKRKFYEHLASVFEELKKNPEFVKKITDSSSPCQMMDVLEEFSGIRMSWLELKQFDLRQAGLD